MTPQDKIILRKILRNIRNSILRLTDTCSKKKYQIVTLKVNKNLTSILKDISFKNGERQFSEFFYETEAAYCLEAALRYVYIDKEGNIKPMIFGGKALGSIYGKKTVSEYLTAMKDSIVDMDIFSTSGTTIERQIGDIQFFLNFKFYAPFVSRGMLESKAYMPVLKEVVESSKEMEILNFIRNDESTNMKLQPAKREVFNTRMDKLKQMLTSDLQGYEFFKEYVKEKWVDAFTETGYFGGMSKILSVSNHSDHQALDNFIALHNAAKTN